jgi:hypothetical protein
MAEYDSSFNAQGSTVVAFECTDHGPRGFGAGVNGSQCGVHGEGMAHPKGSRAVTVQGTGVHGRGDLHGVYGIDGSIRADQEPNLGNPLPPFPSGTTAPVGVVGVTQGHSPAILGDNNILQAEIETFPTNAGGRTNMDDARWLDVGVEGVSKSGHGIAGLAFTGDLTTPLNIPVFLGGTIPFELGSITTSGVAGLSVKGPGLLGVSNADRGGLFISATSAYPAVGSQEREGPPVAQIRLFPHAMGVTQVPTTGTPLESIIPSIVTAPSNLSKNGRVGDLLVTQDPATLVVALWLCVHSTGSPSPSSAGWAQVLLGPVVTAK